MQVARRQRPRAVLDRDRVRGRAAAQRVVWLIIAVSGIALIQPWQRVDNADEVAEVQRVVDSMTVAYESIRAGTLRIDELDVAEHGFSGSQVRVLHGSLGMMLVAPLSQHCVVMHWNQEGFAQVGRLPERQACSPASIDEVPLKSSRGYVPGTGPPFDVTPLILRAWTPVWYLVALAMLAWLAFRAGLDLFMIGFRPDQLPKVRKIPRRRWMSKLVKH